MEDEVILLKIQVDQADVKKQVEAARAQLARLKAEEAAVKDERKKGIITAKEYGESMKAIAGHVGRTNKVIQEGEAILSDYAKVEAEAAKGLTQMKNSLAILTPAQQAHAKSTKEVKDRIAELAAEFKVEEAAIKATVTSMDKLDDAINSLDDAYRGLSQAQREDAEVGGKLLAMRNQLIAQQEKNQRVIENSRKGLKEYIRDVNILGVNVGSTVDSFKSGAEGVQLFAKGMSIARIAAIALVAVPIVAVLSGLYLILTKTQKGMDFLAQATSGITSVFTTLSRNVIAAFNAFAESKTKLADLGNFLQQNLINRFTALGVILQGIYNLDGGKVANGMLQLATGAKNAATSMKTAYDAGVNLAKMNQQIEESEIKLNTERAKSEKIIERQKQIAEDTTKTIAERRKAEQTAIAESIKIQKSEEAVQQLRIKAAKAELVADKNNREYKKKVAEEVAKLDEISKNRIGERTELQNQLNAIDAEGKQKALEDAKKVAAAEAAIAETALIQAKKKGEDTIEIEAEILARTLKLIQARADAEIVGVEKGKGALAQKKLIQAKADLEAIEAAKATAQKIAEIAYNQKVAEIETSLAIAVAGSKAELQLRIESIEAARNKQQEIARATIQDSLALSKENARLVSVADRQINEARQEFERQQVLREAGYADQRLQIQIELGDQTFESQAEVANKRIRLEEETQLQLLAISKKYGQISEKEYDEQVAAVKAKTVSSQRQLDKQIEAQAAQTAENIAATKLANARAGSKGEHEALLETIEAERQTRLAAAGEDAALRTRINAEANRKIRDENERYSKDQINKVLNIATQSIAIINTIGDAQAQRSYDELQKQQDAATKSAGTNLEIREKIEEQYAKKKEEIDKREAERKKKYAQVQAVLNTAVAITAASPNPILIALAALTGIAQLAVINGQKFAQGGVYKSDKKGAYVTGPGTGTSDSINARISNGEAIINARSTAENYQLLSAINSSKGYGRPFPKRTAQPPTFNIAYALPKPITPMFAYAGGVAQSAAGPAVDYNKLSGLIKEGLYEVASAMPQQVLVISDLHSKEADLARTSGRGSVKIG